MNDAFTIGVIVACAAAAVVVFFLYNVYRGVHDSLANAVIGTVYNFRYFQPVTGTYERYLAKVVSIRHLDHWELGRLDFTSDYRRSDKNFKRTPTLVTCQMSDGEHRQFYAERSDMCKRTPVGNLLYNMGVAYLF
jgi:hypothetical protein